MINVDPGNIKGPKQTHVVLDPEIFQRNPGTLNERTKAAPEKGDICWLAMGVGCLECIPSALEVVRFSGILVCRHGDASPTRIYSGPSGLRFPLLRLSGADI